MEFDASHWSWLEWSDAWATLRLLIVLVVITKVISIGRMLYQLAEQKKQLPFADIPYTVPNPHWMLGHLGAMGSDRVVEGQELLCFRHAGPTGISTFWQMNIPVISFLRAQDVTRVARASAERIHIPSLAKHFKRLLGRNSLIMTNGKEWRSNRTIVHCAFLDEALEDAQAISVQTSLRFETAIMGSLRNSSDGCLTMDVWDLTKMVTLDIFGLAALGYDFGCTQNDRLFLSGVTKTFEFVSNDLNRRCYGLKGRLNPLAQHYWIPTASNRKNTEEMTKLKQLLLTIVRKRRAEIETQSEAREAKDSRGSKHKRRRGNLLDHLLWGSINSHGKVDLTDEYLSDFLVTMLFGGYETSSLNLCNTLYLLAKHPEAQERCVEEIARVLGPYPSVPSSDHFNVLVDLPYCCAVIYESLRLLPPVIAIVRNLPRSMSVKVEDREVEIPAKTRVFLSIWWIHRCEANFNKPHEFLPERWVRQDPNGSWKERSPDEKDVFGGVKAANRKHMFAFSAGARSCVGGRFAMRQTSTALAFFLRSFKAELVDPKYTPIMMRSGPNQVPKGGVPMTIRKRQLNQFHV